MKKVLVLLLSVISILLLCSCSKEGMPKENSHKINIYNVDKFINIDDYDFGTPNKTISNENDVQKISNAIDNAEKQEDILDLSAANIILEEIKTSNSSKEEKTYFYLWLTVDTKIALVMYPSDTRFVYALSNEDTEKLKKIIIG